MSWPTLHLSRRQLGIYSLLCGVAFVLYGLALWRWIPNPFYRPDSFRYATILQGVLNGNYENSDGFFAVGRITLLFPLYVVFKLFGVGPWQCAVPALTYSFLTSYLAGYIGLRIQKNVRFSIFLALATLLFPFNLRASYQLLPDPCGTFFFLIAAAFLLPAVRFSRGPSDWQNSAVVCFAIAMATVSRENSFLFLPIFAGIQSIVLKDSVIAILRGYLIGGLIAIAAYFALLTFLFSDPLIAIRSSLSSGVVSGALSSADIVISEDGYLGFLRNSIKSQAALIVLVLGLASTIVLFAGRRQVKNQGPAIGNELIMVAITIALIIGFEGFGILTGMGKENVRYFLPALTTCLIMASLVIFRIPSFFASIGAQQLEILRLPSYALGAVLLAFFAREGGIGSWQESMAYSHHRGVLGWLGVRTLPKRDTFEEDFFYAQGIYSGLQPPLKFEDRVYLEDFEKDPVRSRGLLEFLDQRVHQRWCQADPLGGLIRSLTIRDAYFIYDSAISKCVVPLPHWDIVYQWQVWNRKRDILEPGGRIYLAPPDTLESLLKASRPILLAHPSFSNLLAISAAKVTETPYLRAHLPGLNSELIAAEYSHLCTMRGTQSKDIGAKAGFCPTEFTNIPCFQLKPTCD